MRFRRFRKIIIASAITLSVGAVTAPAVMSALPAYAGTGNQWCYETGGQACLDAWGGGPWVKVETSKGLVNNDFTLVYNHAYGQYQLEFTAHGASSKCIGDGNNDPNNGYAYLVPCGFTGGAGWGSLMTLGSCGSNARCFKNSHWSSLQGRNDWLGPVNNYVDGSNFILNSPNVNYFYFSAPA